MGKRLGSLSCKSPGVARPGIACWLVVLEWLPVMVVPIGLIGQGAMKCSPGQEHVLSCRIYGIIIAGDWCDAVSGRRDNR